MADTASKMVRFKIQGRECEGREGESLLAAIRRAGFEVPSMCYHEAVSPYGACRLCLVEVKKGRKAKLTTSCNYPVQAGIEVLLDTAAVSRHRRMNLMLLMAAAPAARSVQALAARYGITSTPFRVEPGEACIHCGLCSRVCAEIVGAHALGFAGRGVHKHLTTPYEESSADCIGCGACAVICPTGCVKVEDAGGYRIIERWHFKVPLQSCQVCGRSFAPEVQLKRFAAQVHAQPSRFATCPDCRPA